MESPKITLQMLADTIATDKPPQGRVFKVEQAAERVAAFDFGCALDELVGLQASGPKGADVGTHAAAGEASDGNAIFLKDLNDADVGEAAGTATGESEA